MHIILDIVPIDNFGYFTVLQIHVVVGEIYVTGDTDVAIYLAQGRDVYFSLATRTT